MFTDADIDTYAHVHTHTCPSCDPSHTVSHAHSHNAHIQIPHECKLIRTHPSTPMYTHSVHAFSHIYSPTTPHTPPSHTRCVLPISRPCRGPHPPASQQGSGESRGTLCPPVQLTPSQPASRPPAPAQKLLQAPVSLTPWRRPSF